MYYMKISVVISVLILINISCTSKKELHSGSSTRFNITQNFAQADPSAKYDLKLNLHAVTQANPRDNSNLFALFILNSSDPFYYMGGASYLLIGQYVEEELFKKVSIHLFENLNRSSDLWFDIQQVGRWVDQDFVPKNLNISTEEKIVYMSNKVKEYFDKKYKVK